MNHPTEGPRSIAARLALPRFGSWVVSHGGVANVLARAGLARRPARLAAAESLAASEGGPITERALRELRAREVIHRHIGSEVVGEQVFLDTMYVGKLKGVGKVWQYSAVDGACSFGFAMVRRGEKSARAAAAFLEHDVLPTYAEAGIALKEVVVDGGPEFKGEFAKTARRLGISVPRIPPRSPTSTPSSSGSRKRSCTCTTARRSGTVSTARPETSTPTWPRGCDSTTSSDPTVSTGPRAVDRPRSSTQTSPRSSS